jgi:cytochrome c biogenesis protein CcmG/thiol:disulfide interchange protein DsbE
VKKRWLQIVLVSFAALGLVWFLSRDGNRVPVRAAPAQSSVRVGFTVGQSAPDFALRSLDGRMIELTNLRGKPVLLNFWATFCAPCRLEMPWLAELDRQYRPQGVEIVGVSLDDPGEEQAVNKFIAERGVRYPILIGNSSVADLYGGVRFMPQSFFIDRNGKIAKISTGLTGKQDLEEGLKSLMQTPRTAPLEGKTAAQAPPSPNVPAYALIPADSRVPAPDFTVTDLSGGTITRSQFMGKVVLLDFWAVDCGGCRVEIPWYVEFDRNYRDKGLALIGIDMYGESPKVVEAFMKKTQMSYQVAIGNDELGKRFHVEEMPLTLLIDRSGRVALSHAGIVDKTQFEKDIQELLQ